MNGSDKADRVVVLRFVDSLRVDIVADMSEQAAIADFAGRTLAGAGSPDLPLIEAVTAAIPRDRIEALLNGGARTVEPLPEPPAVPIAGIQAAMRAYGGKVITGAAPETVAEAERQLAAFFARYGVKIIAGDGRPDWLPPRDPAEAWVKP